MARRARGSLAWRLGSCLVVGARDPPLAERGRGSWVDQPRRRSAATPDALPRASGARRGAGPDRLRSHRVRAPRATSAATPRHGGRPRAAGVTVDLLGVAVGAGCTPFLAVEVAARWSPPVVAAQLDGVRHACGLGQSFSGALDDAGRDATPMLAPLADALLASVGAATAHRLSDARAPQPPSSAPSSASGAEARARTVPGPTPLPSRLPRAAGVRAPDRRARRCSPASPAPRTRAATSSF